MLTTAWRTAKVFAATAEVPASLLIAGTTIAAAFPARRGADAQNQGVQHLAAPSYRVRQTLNGAKLRHTFVPAGSTKRRSGPLANPDDITVPGHDIYTAFQNGIGPQGQASTDGSTYSAVVEITVAGRVIRQWDIKCKCDGITADTGRHLLIATGERGRQLQHLHDHARRPGQRADPALPVQQAAPRITAAPTPSRSTTASCWSAPPPRHDRQGGPAADLPGSAPAGW